MFTRLPSCKISGAILVALLGFILMLVNAPKAEASVRPIHAGPSAGSLALPDLHIVASHRAGDRLVFRTNDTGQWVATPCGYEDSSNCWWDAGNTGNGRGHSFVAIALPGRVCLMFLSPRYAASHDRCISNRFAS